MTDDTDHAEREDDERAVSIPLIDTFATLEAELSAKEKRIERLERELAERYLDPDGGTQATAGTSGDGAEHDVSEPGDADDESGPRSHEDWEPETDPLSDTGTASDDADHEGVRPTTREASEATEPSEVSDANSAKSTDDSGLKPVRTASTGAEDTAERDDDAESSAEETPTAREEFALTMETSSDLTGGSLGSSTEEAFVAGGGEDLNDDEVASDGETANDGEAANDDEPDSAVGASRPDPTADRGERLSLLVRREELRDEAEVVEAFVRGIEALDDVTQGMLAHYCEAGDAAPVDAHVAAGGSGERQYAYARNRTLRKAGVIEHDGAGRYRYALPDLVAEAFDGSADGQTLASAVAAIESATGLDE